MVSGDCAPTTHSDAAKHPPQVLHKSLLAIAVERDTHQNNHILSQKTASESQKDFTARLFLKFIPLNPHLPLIMSMSFEEATVPRDPKPTPNTPENVFEQLSMKGKVVAITGAADGIGFAAAEAIAEAGGDLALWYRSNDAAIAKSDALAKKHGIRAKA